MGVPPSGPDGRPLLSDRQPAARQSRGHGRAGSHCQRPDACPSTAPARICLTGADFGANARRRAGRARRAHRRRGGSDARRSAAPRAAVCAAISSSTRWARHRTLSRQPQHLRARPVRRPCRAAAAGGRHAAPGRRADVAHALTSAAVRRLRTNMDAARALRPARRAGLLHRRRHRRDPRGRLAGALQQQPHRRPPRSAPSPQWARDRRRRSGPAPLQHPRQSLCDRRGRLHRRHADHPRTRRPLAGRVRLPVHGDRRGPLEDRAARARRSPAVRAGHRREDAAAADRAPLALRRRARSSRPRDIAALSPVLARHPGAGARVRGRSTASRATATSWSNTARSCSTSSCASASTR